MFTLCAALCLCGGFEPVPDVGDLGALLGNDDLNDLVFPDDDPVVADDPVVDGNPFVLVLGRGGFILFSLSVLLVSAAVSSVSMLYMSGSHWEQHLLNSAVFELTLAVCILVYLLYRNL
ncbi:hypothetical protein [Candidatus Ichthyocystis sparus]|uniref:hypothetical protein n=1 Tax=Candidatus Ichthyocystis sparus TaxID=1561004 RepID=UPI000B82A100|nr:hypothetical protein [Candidatus Ichthyocystis sparus]